MALVNKISFGITDFTGARKTMVVYTPVGDTLAQLQTKADTIGGGFDPAIDGQITDISVTIALVVNGVKGAAVVGAHVDEGALLAYSALNTDYAHSYYVPTWSDAGLDGKKVITTPGDYADAETILGNYADRQGNALDAFLRGKRVTRK